MFTFLPLVFLVQTGLFRPFPDVPPNHWAAKAVFELQEAGLLKGYPNGLFRG
jgi:hypothetical protein